MYSQAELKVTDDKGLLKKMFQKIRSLIAKNKNCWFQFIFADLSDHPYLVAVIRCKAMPYVAESLFAALINTLVALTIDRYIAIVHPLTKITKR